MQLVHVHYANKGTRERWRLSFCAITKLLDDGGITGFLRS
jgi:hypothetical protein